MPARYGVPLEIVVAIWGMESNYGSFTGDIPTIDALATLGFEGTARSLGARPVAGRPAKFCNRVTLPGPT